MARQTEHCIRDERLQVQNSILLLKTITVARQEGHCIRDESLQVEDSVSLLKTNRCGKAGRTPHQVRDVTG